MKGNKAGLKKSPLILMIGLILVVFMIALSNWTPVSPRINFKQNEFILLNKTNFNFTVVPIDLDEIDRIHPIGHLTPLGHLFPSDHVYLEYKNQSKRILVYMPADGFVTYIRKDSETSYMMEMRFASNNLMVVYGHLSSINETLFGSIDFDIDNDINLNKSLKAGIVLGTGGGPNSTSACLDFTLLDYNVFLTGFIHPEIYGNLIHVVCPIVYYTEPLKQQLTDKIWWDGIGAPNCGRIDYDQSEKLVGNWFLESWNGDFMESWETSEQYLLSFVYYNTNTSKIHLGIGAHLLNKEYNESIVCFVEGDRPDPANVTVETGKIVYHLVLDSIPQINLNQTMLVQLISEEELKVEIFNGTYTADEIEFTSKAEIYFRGINSQPEHNIKWDNFLLAILTLEIIGILTILKKPNTFEKTVSSLRISHGILIG
ncbi:MAG: hypothetical protein ACTSQI_07595 [Candidatus Helarchaeota archaeon]